MAEQPTGKVSAIGFYTLLMLKIIGGEFRSRRLLTPEKAWTTRPYVGRARESVFNLLRGWFEGARVLDLFAGVGTMGLEAVSRGAASALLVEQDRRVFELLQRNIEALGCGDRAQAMHADALGRTCLLRAPQPVDVMFVDPPFEMMSKPSSRARVLTQIRSAREVLARPSFVVLRSPVGPEQADLRIEGFDGPEVHEYGRENLVLLYQPAADEEPAAEAM